MEASDPELMARLAGGDDLALNELMDRWSARIAAFLHKTPQTAATHLSPRGRKNTTTDPC